MKVASLPHRGHRASALSSLKAPIRILLEHKKGLTLFPCGAGAGGAAWAPGNFFVGATLRGCPLLGGHAGPPLRDIPGDAATGPAKAREPVSAFARQFFMDFVLRQTRDTDDFVSGTCTSENFELGLREIKKVGQEFQAGGVGRALHRR